MATCEALGGSASEALYSASAIELFHNAFLVHDDVEDGSLLRRGLPTLHAKYGMPLAVNAGDAMNVLTLRALLDNFALLGIERTQRIFEEIEWMVLQSVEGQSIELGWVENNFWALREKDYYRMSLKKTGWYTCISPCRIGAVIAGAGFDIVRRFNAFGHHLGIAFQIQDDVLNLKGEESKYGKEASGDLWEGKRTVMLIHLLNSLSGRDHDTLVAILNRPRPAKRAGQVAWVMAKMEEQGSIPYAKEVAWRHARRARELLEQRLSAHLADGEAKTFLRSIVDYVVYREL
jgi:geranylgeranyl diphosphate synthase type II